MNIIKRIFAAAAAVLMAVTFTACHKKDEIAVKIGDVQFTAAYYMCALLEADSEAKSKVQENLSDEEKNGEINYYKQKVDDKDFVEWVEESAIERLKEVAAYETLCKEAKLEISDSDISNSDMYAEYYWTNYGLGSYYEMNGVGLETYKKYNRDKYYSNVYFEHLYGKEGEKAISADEVKNKIYDNYIIADILQASFTDKSDEEKAELKTQFNNYAEEIKTKKRSFEEIYKDYNKTEDTNEDTSSGETDAPKPKDEYASVLGSKETTNPADNYDDIKAMATGEVKVFELDDDAGLMLAVKQDIKADDYYVTTYDLTARHLIKDEEYNKFIEDYAKKLSEDINTSSTKQFKVKKIKEPTSAS